jgi:hypothetical protein
MIKILKILKNSPKKLLNLINTFSKVAVHEINIKKLGMFLDVNNEQAEKEMRKIIKQYH